MKASHLMRRVAVVGLTAAWIGAALVPRASAAEMIEPAPRPIVLQVFGSDPLGSAGPALSASLYPPHPDSFFGWYATPVSVTLLASRPASIRYVWDDPGGRWQPYEGPMIAPEGKRVLYAQAFDGTTPGPLTALELKTDLRSPIAKGAEFTASEIGVQDRATGNPGIVSVSVWVKPFAGPRVIRVEGPDRYGTSEQILRKDFVSAPTVIVARGDLFPDALAASGLAGLYDAPIVLTRPAAMPDFVVKALKDEGTRKVIIMGSVRAVSAKVESQLKGVGLSVERIGGADRYETAALISRAIVARGGQRGAAFVARGDLFPDSLAVSPFAYRAKRPVMLVRPTSLPGYTSKALTDLGIADVVIAGSVRAVSAGVQSGIEGLTNTKATRVEGPDRYGTAVAAADYGESRGLGDFKFVGIATGQNFPDALCGGAACGKIGGVILMTPKDYLCQVTADALSAHGPLLHDIQVYGSIYAVSQKTWDQILQTIR